MKLPHILWINLDTSDDRRKYMNELFNIFNIKNNRISALDGKKKFINYKLNDELDNIKLAVKTSHLKAIKFFVDNNKFIGDHCIIAEDDLSFDYVDYWDESFYDKISMYDNYDIIQLSVHFNKKVLKTFLNEFNIKKPFKRKNKYWSANCYLITLDYAKEILEKNNYKNEFEYFYRFNQEDVEYMKKNNCFVIDDNFIYNDNTYTLPLFTYNTNFESVSVNNSEHHKYNKDTIFDNIWKRK